MDDRTASPDLRRRILSIAVPVSLQSLFQASLGVIDQVMVGRLGTDSVTAVGIASKFTFLFAIMLGAVGTCASIMISQYCGSRNRENVNGAFQANGILAAAVTAAFFLPAFFFPDVTMRMYTNDADVIRLAAAFLRITAPSALPLLITCMLSVMMRNTGAARAPFAASAVSVLLNTGLNYVLIFGKVGAPTLGINGSAIATLIARISECLILLVLFRKTQKTAEFRIRPGSRIPDGLMKQALVIGAPIFLNEFLWGFGDTVYAVVYGHMGTDELAAMTLTAPLQSLTVGLFTGLSGAAGILVGNELGKGRNDTAYRLSQKFVRGGILGSLAIGAVMLLFSGPYAGLYAVPDAVRRTTVRILYVFGAFLFVKVTNMILAGGILRSGGKTKYTLFMDILGTWGIGIPLGFLAAFVWNLPVEAVYFLITTEEAVRLLIGFFVFRGKSWMQRIGGIGNGPASREVFAEES